MPARGAFRGCKGLGFRVLKTLVGALEFIDQPGPCRTYLAAIRASPAAIFPAALGSGYYKANTAPANPKTQQAQRAPLNTPNKPHPFEI